MATLGNKLLSAPSNFLFTSKNTKEQVAVNTVGFVIPPSGGWLTHLGLYVRYVTEDPEISLGAWYPAPGGGPGILLARTDPITIAPAFQGNIEAPIVWTNPTILGGLPSALRVDPSVGLILGWVISGGDAEVGLVPIADVSVWRNNNLTGIPVNPFGSPLDTLTMDPPAIYTTHADSTKPIATLVSPAAAASLTNDAPIFQISVSDVDAAPYGDGIGAYDILVRVQGSPTFIYNEHVITASTPLFGSISHQYAGPDLIGGTTYEWAVRVQDMAGEWSDFTAFRTFSISNVGMVDVSSGALPAANSKVDGNSALIDWTARWWHTAALAGNAVQVRVLNQALAVANLGAVVSKAIAGTDDPPGTLFTVQDTEAGIGSLSPGQQYYWQIAVRASNGVWSDWSQAVPFRTNAVPSIPVPISPPNGFGSTSRQRLVVSSIDIDADDVPLTDVVWDFRLTDVRDSVVRTALADAYDAVLGRPSYQPDATTVPHEGVYLWEARGRDLSAGSFGESLWSAPVSFNFGLGPIVTIDNPAVGETQLTLTPRIDWHTDDDQSAYQIQIWLRNANGTRGALVYNSNKTLSTDTFKDIPPGILLNNTNYLLVVSSWDEGDLRGDSTELWFFISYATIEGLADVTVAMQTFTGDVEPSTPVITWTGTKFPLVMGNQGQFAEYLVKRWDVNLGRANSEVLLARITNISQLSFIDYYAPPNTPLAYAVSQRIHPASAPASFVESGESVVFTTVSLLTPVLVSTRNPSTVRFPFMYLSRDYAFGGKKRRGSYNTWGVGGLPTISGAPGIQRTRSVSFTIRGDQYATLRARRQAIIDLMEMAGPYCLRDEYDQIFMDVSDWGGRRGGIGQLVISASLEEVAFREGAV